MKILYGIQGTGHGHISRAKVVLPGLRERAEVDVLISGYNYSLPMEDEVNFTARGMSLSYNNKGAIDLMDTALNLQPVRFLRDIQDVPIENYDFVVNDFEPVTAWAARKVGLPCVAISHQASFLSDRCPRPVRESLVAEQIFRHFAPCTAAVACHYRRYEDFIEPPIIRKPVLGLNPYEGDHITVYLPAFKPEFLQNVFKQVTGIRFEVFTTVCTRDVIDGNVTLKPVGYDSFLKSLESSAGIISASGFETTSEAMYLGKKLLTIPIRNQYEQLCNSVALKAFGAEVVRQPDASFPQIIRNWIRNGARLSLPELSDETELIHKILEAGTGRCFGEGKADAEIVYGRKSPSVV